MLWATCVIHTMVRSARARHRWNTCSVICVDYDVSVNV